MGSVTRSRGPIHLGLDVHKDSISAGILRAEAEEAEVVRIGSDDDAVRHLLDRFADRGQLRACYEAGPTGYELHRLLTGLGVPTTVVAPSLIPRAPGERVKTDRRDCRRLARLHRAGELVAVHVPTRSEEGLRDLCRARADLLDDLQRARRRLASFLLRHGRVYRGGSAWTGVHEKWLAGQDFAEPALRATYAQYRAVLTAREADLTAIEAELTSAAAACRPLAESVQRLGAYRGVAELGAITLAVEVTDWRRFPTASGFMGFTGLVPSEHSSGGATRRGHITKTGNAHLRTQLIESAWAYQHRPIVGTALRARQQGAPAETLARSWRAQRRLCRRFRALAARKNVKGVVVTAIARELAGFLWAEMTSTPAASA
jgi:transposase